MKNTAISHQGATQMFSLHFLGRFCVGCGYDGLVTAPCDPEAPPSYLDVAVLAGQVQRRGALVGACVDVGAVADEQGGQCRVSVQCSHMERRKSVHVAAVNTQRADMRYRQLQYTHTHTHVIY